MAGNKGTLNKQQLAGCLYLMDNAKRGVKPPQKLPPGPFPPVVRPLSRCGMAFRVFGGLRSRKQCPVPSCRLWA